MERDGILAPKHIEPMLRLKQTCVDPENYKLFVDSIPRPSMHFASYRAEEGLFNARVVPLINKVEQSINKEISKFLNENQIILPKGFEEYQAPLERICP